MPYCPECSIAVPDDVTCCPTCGASLQSTPTTEPDGLEQPRWDLDRLQATLSASLAPNYEVLRPLGQGGMGAIYLAREPALKRLVAVKVLAPSFAADNRARVRFEREARAAAAISHPNVVQVYAVGETKRSRLPYIVMQYVDGPNLEEWRLRRGRVSERDARRVIGEIAAALAAAHERDFVHRDVKPSNVLIEKETGRAFVADFGVSAALSSATHDTDTKLTSTGVVVGTPTYMSPEQGTSDPVTAKSDVYSLGVVAYQLLTGQLPFRAESAMGWAAAHLRDRPSATSERRPEISPAVGRMIDRCLAKAPKDRPDADEIARGMLPSLETEIEWPPPGLLWLRGRSRGLIRMALTAVAGATLAAAALSFYPDIVAMSRGLLARFDFASDLAATVQRGRERIAGGPLMLMYLWQTAVIVGLVTYCFAGVSFLFLAVRFLDRAVRQRMRGWNTDTLLDVAADHDGRTGMIVAGSGDFASFRESTRRKILLSRRGRSAAVLAGSSWIVVALGAHFLCLALGFAQPETTTTLLSATDVTLVLAPGGACLLGALACIMWERLLLGRLSRSHSFDAEPEDIARWYEGHPAEGARPAAALTYKQDRLAVWSSRFNIAALLLFAPVTLVGMVVASLATFTATRFPEWHRPGAASLTSSLEHVARHDPIEYARSSWAPYLPQRDSTPVEVATELLRVLNLSPGTPGGLPAYDIEIPSLFEWDAVEGRTGTDIAFERAFRQQIPADTLEMLSQLANHPRTGLLRRLSATPHIDVWNALSADGASGDSTISPQWISLRPTVMEAVRANVLAAVLDAAQEDPSGAAARLGENAGFGEHLLQAPLNTVNREGMYLLSNHALLPLASFERARGEIDRAVLLARAAEQLGMVRSLGDAVGLATDPSAFGEFTKAVTEDRIPSGYRILWLQQGWAGLCAYPREILIGPSRERITAMQAVADSVAHLPFAREGFRSSEARWRWPFTSARVAPDDTPKVMRALDRLFLGSMLRILACVDPSSAP